MNKLCDQCETVAHCSQHGCIPSQPNPKDGSLLAHTLVDIDLEALNQDLINYRAQIARLRARVAELEPVRADADGYVAAEPVPTIAEAVELLVSALAASKGWLRDYARAKVMDAIDPTEPARLEPEVLEQVESALWTAKEHSLLHFGPMYSLTIQTNSAHAALKAALASHADAPAGEVWLEKLNDLIGNYWGIAYQEGVNGGETDSPDGRAQKKWLEIQAHVITRLQPVAAPEGKPCRMLSPDEILAMILPDGSVDPWAVQRKFGAINGLIIAAQEAGK